MKKIEQKAHAICKKWQKILNLQDWYIDVQLVKELPDEKSEMACFVGDFAHHRVCIYFTDPKTWKDILGFEKLDLEEVITHELIHLHMASFFPKKQHKQDWAELAINQLTRAFLKLDRRKKC